MNRPLHKIKATTALAVLFSVVLMSAVFLPSYTPDKKESVGVSRAYADTAVIQGSESVLAQYPVGETLTVPEAELLYDGKTYKASHTLRLPNGTVEAASKIVLTAPGRYVLEYRAFADSGSLIKDSVEFDVINALYGVNGTKSEISYGSHSDAPLREGVKVRLASGEAFTYNKIIDLTQYDKNTPIFQLYFTPEIIGVADAKKLIVTFEDIYDSENAVTVIIKDYNSSSKKVSAVLANAPGQRATGVRKVDEGIYYDGYYYSVERENAVGNIVNISMRGNRGIGEDTYFLAWDYNNPKRELYSAAGHNPTRLVTALNEPSFYDTLWDGFTTGQVRMSFKAQNYETSHMNFIITELDGLSGQELINNSFAETVKPAISVDYGDEYSESSVPTAVCDMDYKVFPAWAKDLNGENLNINTMVYYGYYTNSKGLIKISNGCFKPVNPGVYTILYTATDKSGNVITKTVDVTAKKSTDGISVSLTGKNNTGGLCGEDVKVATSAQLTGEISGKGRLTITAVHKEGKASYAVDTKTLTFVPFYAGEYEITYTVSDYVQSGVLTGSLTVQENPEPKIFDKVTLPKYFIKNCTYTLPALTAYNFSGGSPIISDVNASVEFDGSGSSVNAVGGKITITGDSEAVITYNASASGQGDSHTYDAIPIVDVGYGNELDMRNYFTTIKGNIEKDSGSNYISIATGTDGSVTEFINPLLADDFALIFSMDADDTDGYKNEFESVNVYLKDSADENIALKFSYTKSGEGSVFKINDDTPIASSLSFSDSANFNIYYYDTERTVSIASQSVKVTSDMYGNTFGGFPSRKVYVSIEFEGVEQDGIAGLRLITLNNQPLSNKTTDTIGPQITMSSIKGEFLEGEKTTVKPVFAIDVLDPGTSLTMEIKAPDGTTVISDDGIPLDAAADPTRSYTITLSQYGVYDVSYVARDKGGAGNKSEYLFVINCIDVQPPVITLSGEVVTGKIGEKINIATAEAADNKPGQIKLNAYLLTPDGKLAALSQDYFIPDKAGEYRVVYSAYDASSNMTVVSYTVEIS